MNPNQMIDALECTGRALLALAASATPEEMRLRPAAGKWSMLEILCHLIDEERDDFRLRVRSTLEDPARSWPPIHPEDWARDRDYNARPAAAMRDEFERERAISMAWLRGLRAPDWEQHRVHPSLGPLRAGDLLASWVAHDVLHLRQMAAARVAHLETVSAPYSTRYAQP